METTLSPKTPEGETHALSCNTVISNNSESTSQLAVAAVKKKKKRNKKNKSTAKDGTTQGQVQNEQKNKGKKVKPKTKCKKTENNRKTNEETKDVSDASFSVVDVHKSNYDSISKLAKCLNLSSSIDTANSKDLEETLAKLVTDILNSVTNSVSQKLINNRKKNIRMVDKECQTMLF